MADSEWPRVFFSWLPARHRERIVATVLGPAGPWWLKERIIGRLPLLTGHEINAAAERHGRLRLSMLSPGGKVQMDTDRVIAATGYKVVSAASRSSIRRYGRASGFSMERRRWIRCSSRRCAICISSALRARSCSVR
jgi:hypothetical protein